MTDGPTQEMPGFPPIGDAELGGGGPWSRVSSLPGPAGTATEVYTSPTGAQLRVLVAAGGTPSAVQLVAAADRVHQLAATNAAGTSGIHSRGVGADGSVWVALDDYRLPSVADMARTGQRLDPPTAYRSADAVLGVLDAAQTAGVHGLVVTPDTVHVAQGGAPVVDLLTATIDPARGTVAYHPDGSAGPAVVPGQAAAAGGVLYAMMTGRVGTIGAPPPSVVMPGLDPRFDVVPQRALSPDPGTRYSTLSQMRADVAATLATTAAPPAPPPGAAAGAAAMTAVMAPVATAPVAPVKKSRAGRVWAVVAILAILALVAGGVWWFLSQGQKTTVPNVVGQAQAAAEQKLIADGFAIGTVANVNSDRAVGTVLTQDPAAGAEATKGTKVNLQVSAGQAQITVPSVVGQQQSAATNALLAAKLQVGEVKQVASNQPAGAVIAQSPTAGTKVAPGTKVNLQVSTGQVAVPNVVGQTAAVAAATLTNAGFNVTEQTVATAPPGAKAGSVVAQDPTAGQPLKEGGTVVISVYTPETPTTSASAPEPSAS